MYLLETGREPRADGAGEEGHAFERGITSGKFTGKEIVCEL